MTPIYLGPKLLVWNGFQVFYMNHLDKPLGMMYVPASLPAQPSPESPEITSLQGADTRALFSI